MKDQLEKIRNDFPILSRKVNGNDLVYLDSAATSQKPNEVIEAISHFYRNHNSNVHRGSHSLSEESTLMLEASRKLFSGFIGSDPEELVFTRNATESLNLVAYSYLQSQEPFNGRKGILTSILEHHSNFVPWLNLKQKGFGMEIIGITPDGQIDLAELEQKLDGQVGLVSLSMCSNVTGAISDIKKISRLAHSNGSLVMVDAAQSVSHMPVDFKALGCDFLAFSGHKMLGPTGIGGLVCRKKLLLELHPFLLGGDMIKEVHRDSYSLNSIPHNFEAGTPDIVGIIGLAAAVDYLDSIGINRIREHSKGLSALLLEGLSKINGINIIGPLDPSLRGSLVSFTQKGVHPHDISQILNDHGIAVRAGHHCCQPLHEHLGIAASTRASYHCYNTEQEIHKLLDGLRQVKKVLS